ncbi:MAG TPA: molecular chaperone TorD family protein [Candidatus Methylomirabilis sp.]|nr:molecular chaperone TorD family protein [Candidatus Methylomirabilis sp.]
MAIHRAFCYQFLSLAFSYPEEGTLTTLEAGLADLVESLRALAVSYDAARLQPALREARERLLDHQGEYNALFATALKAPSWETAYEIDKTARRATELADIQGFYRAFGLALCAPVEADNLVTELEFLSLLQQKKHYALRERNGEGAEVCEDAYQKFLADHLGRWHEAFLHRLTEAAEEEYYREIGLLLNAVLNSEMAGLHRTIRRLAKPAAEPLEENTWPCEPCAPCLPDPGSSAPRQAQRRGGTSLP